MASPEVAPAGVARQAMGTMPDVSFFIPSPRVGGAERAMSQVAALVARRGLAVDLVLSGTRGPQRPEGPRVVPLGARRVAASVARFARYLRRERPGVVVSSLTHANVAAVVARRLGSPATRLVLVEHTSLSRHPRYSYSAKDRLLPMAVRRLYPRADTLIAVSRAAAGDLSAITHVPLSDIPVIPNPISVEEIRTAAAEAVSHPWFSNGDAPVVLAVAALSPPKDIERLVRVFARARSQRDARLLVLGEGPRRPQIERQVRALGLEDCVDLPGFETNPYRYMARSALVVLASRAEGLPTVLLEGLALGTPLVATDCPGGTREILAGGRYGSLVPTDDDAALVDAIVETLEGRRATVPDDALEPYGPERVADRYLEALFP